jgi:hypothetical protein
VNIPCQLIDPLFELPLIFGFDTLL